MVWDFAINPLPIIATPSSGTDEATRCRVICGSRFGSVWRTGRQGSCAGKSPSNLLPSSGQRVQCEIHSTPHLANPWEALAHSPRENSRPQILPRGWKGEEPADAGWTYISF